MCVVVMQCNPSERLLTPSPAWRIDRQLVHSLVPNSVTKLGRSLSTRVDVHTDIVTIHAAQNM